MIGNRGHVRSIPAVEDGVSDNREGGAAAYLRAEMPRRRRDAWSPLAAMGIALAVTAALAVVAQRPSQPAIIAAAITDFRGGRLPASSAPTRTPPDLSAAGLTLRGAGSGRLRGRPVDAFAYRDAAGRRVLLLLSDRPFPVAAGASTRPDGAWTASEAGVELLSAQRPQALLALSEGSAVLRQVALALGVGGLADMGGFGGGGGFGYHVP